MNIKLQVRATKIREYLMLLHHLKNIFMYIGSKFTMQRTTDISNNRRKNAFSPQTIHKILIMKTLK